MDDQNKTEQKIKCVIWDLDNTIWNGILSEGLNVTLNKDAARAIKALDERGILHSISSKNNLEDAKAMLIEFGLWEYFIYPQINWSPKSESVSIIAKSINIGTDTLAFIDDQAFERDEVFYSLNDVLCLDVPYIPELLDMERFMPLYITEDSKNRRRMYQDDILRNETEKEFTGTKEEFLKTLDMVFTVKNAGYEDLKRAEDLTVRTHQLNSTGYVYSFDELNGFIESEDHQVLIAGLVDKYGDYGKIGLALLQKHERFRLPSADENAARISSAVSHEQDRSGSMLSNADPFDNVWELKLLLMSCRVMSRGVGNVFLSFIVNKAITVGASLLARFLPTERNRLMYITYKFNGFTEIAKDGDLVFLSADMSYERIMPDIITLVDKT